MFHSGKESLYLFLLIKKKLTSVLELTAFQDKMKELKYLKLKN